MSVITEVVNPADDSVALKAKGVIKRVFIKRINADGSAKVTHINKGPNAGKTISSTHRYSILLTAGGVDEFVSFGEGEVKNLKYENQFQVKQADGSYKDLLPGAEISIYPVQKQTYEKDGKTNTSYQGKKKDIKILVDAPADAAPQQSSAPAQSGGGKGAKIYGEILSIEGNVAVVNDEKQGEGRVVLSDEQLAEVSVGGRLAAFVDISTGNIINSFKAYGPVGQGGGAGGKGKRTPYDPVGVSAGHAMNALVNLKLSGFKGDVEAAGKVVHDVTTKLIKELSETEGKDVGQTVGNAVKFAVTTIAVKGKTIDAEELEKATREAYALAAAFYAYASTIAQEEAQKPSQPVQEPLSGTVEAPPVDFDDAPPMDFDDDIPF